jgi:hypothetical protein
MDPVILWFEAHPVSTTVIVALIAAIPALLAIGVPAWRYVSDHQQAHKQQRFENYHRLIAELVEGRPGQEKPRLDSQIAIVFELRNYPEYRDLSRRLLQGLQATWPETEQNGRLHQEMGLTLQSLARR